MALGRVENVDSVQEGYCIYHKAIRSYTIVSPLDQGFGRRVPPIYTTVSSVIARVTLYLTGKKKFDDFVGAAYLTTPFGTTTENVKQHEML